MKNNVIGPSYRNRILLFIAVVAILMITLLAAAYYGARWIIWEDAALHRQQTIRLYERSIERLRIDLTHFANTVRNDPRVKEYIFAVAKIGADADPIVNLIREQFQTRTFRNIAIKGVNGRLVYGNSGSLIDDLLDIDVESNNISTHYKYLENSVIIAVMMPIQYRNDLVGYIAVSHSLDDSWLASLPRAQDNHLFITHNEIVISSTHPEHVGSILPSSNRRIKLGTDIYHVDEIQLPASPDDFPRLWLAESESTLIKTLARYNRLILVLGILSLAILLSIGLYAVNRFSSPINRLLTITREMASGKLPKIQKSSGDTELDQLLNQFSDLVEALRMKQEEVEAAHAHLHKSSITDELTGLHNRRHLNEVYPKLMAQAARDNYCLSAILCDLDHFKHINDTYGHAAGDHCLKYFSNILHTNCRSNDHVFRIGGEEFLVLTLSPACHNINLFAEKLRLAACNTPIIYDGQTITLTVSCGIAQNQGRTGYQPSLSKILSLADHALYAAKSAGRNCIRFSTESNIRSNTET